MLHGLGQVQDHRAQAGVPAAEGRREEAVRAADVQHVLRPPSAPGSRLAISGAQVLAMAASPAGSPATLPESDPGMEVERLARAHEVADVLDEIPLEELQEHLVAERLRRHSGSSHLRATGARE